MDVAVVMTGVSSRSVKTLFGSGSQESTVTRMNDLAYNCSARAWNLTVAQNLVVQIERMVAPQKRVDDRARK